jgi:MoaA/NifB/PqqE/SkfB family radical SAM enzyme/SAM-dependent methyltransferase
MKALIKVGYGCNENCTFCHTLEVRHVNGPSEEVEAKIRRARALGHSMVVFSGGEATIRPELWRWAQLTASLGMELGLVTNGLVLSYPDVVERLLALKLRYVYMSLHGGRRTHRAVVRADTFDQAIGALRNLTGKGLDLTVNTVIVRQNVDHLREVVDAVLPFPDAVLKFSMVQPKGGGDHLFETLTPRVAYAAERVLDAIRYGREKAGPQGLRFAHDGLPLCLLPGEESAYDDLKTHHFAAMVEIGEADFFPVDDKDKIQPGPCEGCALRGPCPGLFRGYYESFGDSELRPVRGRARSNSFNYVLEGVTTWKGDSCPLLSDSVTPWDRSRHLFVRHRDRLARFRTDTRDFADVELHDIKHRAGQVYVDLSHKDAPNDFAADLVKLERSPLCEDCIERDRCTGLYQPLLEDIFTRDDSRVRELISGLRGDVLDVGCGEGPYDRLLGPLASEGRIRYVGTDPDPAHLEAQRERRPWATLHQRTAEALEDVAVQPAETFDHVLVLRSWNHIADPARAVRGLVRVLKPGGTLLVVDNEAFGLARTPGQARRGESSPALFEHFRNDRAADAAHWFEGSGLELLERRDVGPATSNQWLLRYRRPIGSCSG